MNIGKMRFRVTIQYKSVVRDSVGGETVTWTDEATVWASINALRGREYFASQQIQGEATHKIEMWYRKGLTPDKRLKEGNRIFDIKQVIPSGQGNSESLILYCTEDLT